MPDDFDFSPDAARKRAKGQPPSQPLMTQTLCFFCVLITLAYFTPDAVKGPLWGALGKFGLVSMEDLWNGKFYGLFTSFFVHLSIGHILFNMMWFWRIGGLLETSIAPWKYLLFLMGAALVGSCSEIVVSGQTGAGASGVVYAIFGLLWAGRGSFPAWRSAANRQNLNYFVIWGLLCVVFTYTKVMPIANGAHWGGFLYGLAVGNLFAAPRRQPLWGIALALLGGVCVLSLTWLPWSWPWQWAQGSKAYGQGNYAAAIQCYERSLKLGGDVRPLKENMALSWEKIAFEADRRHDEKAAEAALNRADTLRREAEAMPSPNEAESKTPSVPQDLESIRQKLLKTQPESRK